MVFKVLFFMKTINEIHMSFKFQSHEYWCLPLLSKGIELYKLSS